MEPRTVKCLKWLLLAAFLSLAIQTSEAGRLRRLLYYNYSGAVVTNLFGLNDSGFGTFPASPEAHESLPYEPGGPYSIIPPYTMETDPANRDHSQNYGSYIQGYLTAPETGDFVFYLSSDDEAQFWMTTDNTDPLNATKTNLLCHVPGWSNPREWNKYSTQQSDPVSLEKGKTYYLEIFHKEGTGGDHIVLGWQTPSGLLEQPMPAWHFQPIRDTRWGDFDTEVVAGPVAVESSTDYAIYEGRQVVVYANINLAMPVTYQWYRNGGLVPGATDAYYIFKATLADNGSQWVVRVVSGGTTYESQPGVISVLGDSTKPTVVQAGTVPNNPTQVQVLYSEGVTPVAATNLANYNVPGATISKATLQPDGRTVVLDTGLLTLGTPWNLSITAGVTDLAGNTLNPVTVPLMIAEGGITFRYWDARPTDLGRLRLWAGPDSTSPSYVNDLFAEERLITTTSYQWNLSPALENFTAQMVGYLTPPETGYYKFAVASDDHSILYLGTSADRSTKREICYYNGSTGRWNTGAQLANQQSAPIYLEAGQTYYIEAVYRDGTGGDGVSVFWQTPSGPPLPTANASVQATTEPFLIPVQYLSTFADPPVTGRISYRIWDRWPTDLATLRTWSAPGTTAPSYTKNLFSEERTITTTTIGWPLRTPLLHDYMAQIVGYITAPETGNYRFGVAVDDHAILYLGTTDQPSSKVERCSRNGSTTQWNFAANADQLSGDIPLVAGQRYYFEVVYRDGGGGDGITVVWYTPSMASRGDVWPPANSQAGVTPYLIPAGSMSTFSTNNFGYMALNTDLPASVSAAQSTRPTLAVEARGSQPYTYQWYKNGAPIAGANAASYTLPFLQAADNNATFYAVVNNTFSSVTSVVATLTVTADVSKPALASAGSLFKQTVEVRLSEPVTAASAANTANYVLKTIESSAVSVTSAVLDPADATHVTLQTAAMPDGVLMTLEVQGLADGAGNAMDPFTTILRANNFDALTRINNTQAYSATVDGDRFIITAGGSDIWGTGDQCAFLHKTVTGDFDYQVQGIACPGVDNWTKLGLMVRTDTTAGARNLFNAWTPYMGQDDFIAQVRDAAGGSSTSANDASTPLNTNLQGGQGGRPDVEFPYWLRLKRVGNNVFFYRSADGLNWTLWTYYDSSASADGALPSQLQLGVALTSHLTSMTADAFMAGFSPVPAVLEFTLQPTNNTVVENGSVTFYAAMVGTAPPFQYQWLKNGSPIADATTATLTISPVSFCTDNNAQYALRVTDYFGQVITTTNATLTVIQDTVIPTVAFYMSPKINLVGNEVKLIFSEMVTAASAQNVVNYAITSVPGNLALAINSATLQPDGRTVVLSTAAQTPGATYKIVINNVVDLACQPANPIPANSTDYFFYAGSSGKYTQRDDGFVFMEAENAQRFVTGTTPVADWQLQSITPGYSGFGYMNITNIGGTTGGTAVSGGVGQGTGPAIVFDVVFTKPAQNYTIWIRGLCANDGQPTGNNDSVYVGIDGNLSSLGPAGTDVNYAQMTGWGSYTVWDWRSDASAGTDPLVLTNVAPGLHTIHIWEREDGTCIDKVCIEPGVRSNAGNSTEPSVASGNGGLGDAETWEFEVQPPGAPTITITSPVNNQTFPGGATISVEATVVGATPIELVEFFEGTNLLGTVTAAPYSVSWPNVPEGIYTLTARAHDVLGYSATSASVRVVVDGTKPVAYAVGSRTGSSIGVYFSDLSGLEPTSATTLANYTVNGGAVAVTGATLEPDGLAVMLDLASPISGQLSVEIKNVTDNGAGPNVVTTTTLQSQVIDWLTSLDVGTVNATPPPEFTDPVMPGFAQAIDTDGFYVHAGGSDIWGAADAMHFVHKPITGNFDVAVRVAGLRHADAWSKAGLMVRVDMDANSRNYLIAATPTTGQNLITMQWRSTKAAASGSLADALRPRPCPIPNAWLRITRVGQVFTFYWGTDGVQWTELYSIDETPTPYPDTVLVGVATTSHNNGATLANTTGAYFRDLTGFMAPPAAPTIQVAVQGGNFVLTWTTTDPAFVLQSSATINTGWLDDPVAHVVAGDTHTVTVPIGSGAKFYRLMKP